MNLNAISKSGKIELWQTPSQISYTICVDENGVAGELTGKNAKRALQAYCQWIRYSTNGGWNSVEELEDARALVKEHLEYVESFLESKGLKVWIM